MRAIEIVLLCILAAVVYGIVHDQITARICVEYFTIGHPPVFGTDDPTLLGLGWGVIATWWVGAILGVGLALSCRVGARPKLTARQLIRPIAILLGAMALAATLAGAGGYLAASRGWIRLLEPLAFQVPPNKQVAFIADGAAHLASYAGGFVGGVALCVYCVRARGRRAAEREDAAPPAST